MTIGCILLYLCLSGDGALTPAAERHEPLILEYSERPPYAWTDGRGAAQGTALNTVRTALDKAGIEYRLLPVPANRQIVDIERSASMVCGIARYKTSEREHIAKFSMPLIEERPYVVFSRKSAGLSDQVSLPDLLGDRSMRVVLEAQRSFGDALDSLLARSRATILGINGNAVNAARMILSGRGDVALLTLDEVDFVKSALALPDDAFALSRIVGLEKGENSYLMCSRSADDSLLQAIDAMLPLTSRRLGQSSLYTVTSR